MSEVQDLQRAWREPKHWPHYLASMSIDGLRGWKGNDISFDYPVIALAGQNGCGKTTALQMAAYCYANKDGKPYSYPNPGLVTNQFLVRWCYRLGSANHKLQMQWAAAKKEAASVGKRINIGAVLPGHFGTGGRSYIKGPDEVDRTVRPVFFAWPTLLLNLNASRVEFASDLEEDVDFESCALEPDFLDYASDILGFKYDAIFRSGAPTW